MQKAEQKKGIAVSRSFSQFLYGGLKIIFCISMFPPTTRCVLNLLWRIRIAQAKVVVLERQWYVAQGLYSNF